MKKQKESLAKKFRLGIGFMFVALLTNLVAGAIFGNGVGIAATASLIGFSFVYFGMRQLLEVSEFMLLGLFAAVVAIAGSFSIPESFQLLTGDVASGISVEEAPENSHADIFYFEDGTILKQYQTAITVHRKDREYYSGPAGRMIKELPTTGLYCVAPLVPDNWDANRDQVPAWAAIYRYNDPTFDCTRAAKDVWDQPLQAAVRIRSSVAVYRSAIRKASKEHGLLADYNAPILKMIPSPGMESLKKSSIAIGSFLAAGLLWLFTIYLVRRKQTKADVESSTRLPRKWNKHNGPV